MPNQKIPYVDPDLVKILEKMYPPLDYSKDVSREDWAFRGGQRELIKKLFQITKQQERG
jgi:hypothetical protein